MFKLKNHSKLRRIFGLFLGTAFSLPVTLLFLVSAPQEIIAQSSNPWNLYNNPTYGNALDASLGPSTVDPPPLRLHSNGNLMVRNNIILGQTQAINTQTWTSSAKALIFNSASTPWWIRQNASDTFLAFGSTANVTDGYINFSIDSSGNAYLPKANSTLRFPGISGNTGAFMGIATSDGNMSDGIPYYGAWGREPGAWSGTYPDFILNNHTGVRIAAHGGYGGVSIYEELNPAQTLWTSSGNEVARFRDDRWGGSSITGRLNVGGGLTVANANQMGSGYNGLTQAYGNYIWPGRLDGSGANWQQSWYLGSHSSYGLFTNTGVYISGTSWAPFIYDSQNTAYYMDPNSVSQFNYLYRTYGFNGPEYDANNSGYYLDPNSTSNSYASYRYYGFNGPEYDGNNGGYYVDPNGTSQFANLYRTYGFSGPEYDINNGGYYVDPNGNSQYLNLYRNAGFNGPEYDINNSGYYMDPNGRSRMNDAHFDYLACMSSWCPQNTMVRLTPNLHLNSVGGYAVYLNWDNGGAAAGTYQLVVGNGAGSTAFIARADGAIYSSASGWIASDERLKKNIQPVSKALDKILALEGVTFEYRKDIPNRTPSDGTHLGLIAQQVEKIIPEVVSDGPEGYKTVAYTDLIPVIIEGVKEQQNQLDLLNKLLNEGQVENMKKQLEEQKKINTDLQSQIDSLKDSVNKLQAR